MAKNGNGATWARWAIGLSLGILLTVLGFLAGRIESVSAKFTDHCYAAEGRFVRLEERQQYDEIRMTEIMNRLDAIVYLLENTRGNSLSPERPIPSAR